MTNDEATDLTHQYYPPPRFVGHQRNIGKVQVHPPSADAPSGPPAVNLPVLLSSSSTSARTNPGPSRWTRRRPRRRAAEGDLRQHLVERLQARSSDSDPCCTCASNSVGVSTTCSANSLRK